MRLLRQFQACLFFFFTKRFWEHKIANQPKPTNKNKNKGTKNNNGNSFCAHENFLEGGNCLLWVLVHFERSKSFRKKKKKKKKTWNCLNSFISLYYSYYAQCPLVFRLLRAEWKGACVFITLLGHILQNSLEFLPETWIVLIKLHQERFKIWNICLWRLCVSLTFRCLNFPFSNLFSVFY